MATPAARPSESLLAGLGALLPNLQSIYTDIHSHPELSMQETRAPSAFWFVGGIDRQLYAKAQAEGRTNKIPTNHNPRFAPVLDPTLHTGVEYMVTAAQAWLRT